MIPFTDQNVWNLYLAVRTGDEPMINDIQRGAVEMLGELAGSGNSDARLALRKLSCIPDLHPIIREQIKYGLLPPSGDLAQG